MTEETTIIEPLSKAHDRSLFDCGNNSLNTFVKQHARQNQEKSISRTFIISASTVSHNGKKPIMGYYTLASGQVDHQDLPNRINHPRYPISIVRLARLAVDLKHQNKGLGKFLLFDALNNIKEAAKLIGIYAVVVDAKSKRAKTFYQQYGFIPLQDELTLFLPLAAISEL